MQVGGRLRCLGSIQHLKDRYGRGYQLEVKLDEPRRESVYAVGDSILASLRSQAPLEGAIVSRQQAVATVCAALGNPARASEINEHGSGWAIDAAFRKSSLMDGAVPVLEFAAWWAGEDMADACTAYVTGDDAAFPGAELVERQGSQMRFRLPPLEQPLGVLFSRIESARSRLGIRSYACGQTSLEQIFNFFAAQQSEEVRSCYSFGIEMP